ncbi:GIY-YIG nuclease family protein [Stenotrophomonas rhizophila]|uniref:GIY-YIG nuclease family protein n=1 Tax=Stenotrophomonas rhizophila TaxID=216778 RepID=A0A7V8CC24_9GAMM|nr:GIY-YIG nuclease family protein [Stenotrophomonas rhizophila]KAB7628924.1 GIY-YIG nuclease family protein [Stenotrophomonas rhizophila]
MKWGRSQKYQNRDRHIYALLFSNGCVYVGQTVNLKDREQQHRRSGGWKQSFTFHSLDTVHGTQAQAEDYEFAWRNVANRAGHTIYGLAPNIVVSATKKMTFERQNIARGKVWPLKKRWKPWPWATAASVALPLLWWIAQ